MPYVPGGSGYPQTSSNRTRANAILEILEYVGGEEDIAAQGRAGRVWDAAVREFNSVAWKFNRLVEDISLSSSMLDNTTAPSVSRDAGAGVGFTLATGKTITYWAEERVKIGSQVARRNVCPSTKTVALSGDGTNDKPVITRPSTVNADTTHWALFGTATNGIFPDGAEISEVAIATTTIEDLRTGNNPELPVGELYYVSRYLLNADFRNPKSAVVLDTDGGEVYQVDWMDFEEFVRWNVTDLSGSASGPEYYTMRNLHETGEVIVIPRQLRPATYPTLRLTYCRRIALAPGASDVLDVPLEMDEAIFQLAVAKMLAKVKMFEASVAAHQLANALRFAVETEYRDYADWSRE